MSGNRAFIVVAAAACVATSCSAAASFSEPGTLRPVHTPTASASPSLPPGTHELPETEGGRLSSGRFTKADFSPALSFRLGRGWHAGHDIAGFFDVQKRPNTPDVIAVQFGLPVTATSAADAIRQLRQTHGLAVTDRGRTTIGGRPTREVLIDSRNPRLQPQRYTPIFSVAGGSLYIASGRRLLVDFVEPGGTLVAVLVGGSVRSWDATMRVAMPVVRSIRFL